MLNKEFSTQEKEISIQKEEISRQSKNFSLPLAQVFKFKYPKAPPNSILMFIKFIETKDK